MSFHITARPPSLHVPHDCASAARAPVLDVGPGPARSSRSRDRTSARRSRSARRAELDRVLTRSARGPRRGRSRPPRRRSPSARASRPPPGARAGRPGRRCPRRAAGRSRPAARGRGGPARGRAPVPSTGDRRATTAGTGSASRWATSAAAPTTTPSSSTGVRRTAAWSRNPLVAAMSGAADLGEQVDHVAPAGYAPGGSRRAPPRTCASTPGRRCRCPGRRRSATSESVSSATSVAAGVVLPIPMSPAISRSAPASTSSSAIGHARAQRLLGLLARHRRPDRDVAAAPPHLVVADAGQVGQVGVDRHVDHAHARARPAGPSTLTAAPPATKLRTICAVTSGG